MCDVNEHQPRRPVHTRLAVCGIPVWPVPPWDSAVPLVHPMHPELCPWRDSQWAKAQFPSSEQHDSLNPARSNPHIESQEQPLSTAECGLRTSPTSCLIPIPFLAAHLPQYLLVILDSSRSSSETGHGERVMGSRWEELVLTPHVSISPRESQALDFYVSLLFDLALGATLAVLRTYS